MKAEGLTPLQILQQPQRLMIPLFHYQVVILKKINLSKLSMSSKMLPSDIHLMAQTLITALLAPLVCSLLLLRWRQVASLRG